MPRLEFEVGEFDFSISVPLDTQGYLRRACPTCQRELKWKAERRPGRGPQGNRRSPASSRLI
jgi:hypothetical protein